MEKHKIMCGEKVLILEGGKKGWGWGGGRGGGSNGWKSPESERDRKSERE